MIKAKDIIHENGDHWVMRNRKEGCYSVMVSGATHSISDSHYSLDDDGLSIAVARCDYLAQRSDRSRRLDKERFNVVVDRGNGNPVIMNASPLTHREAVTILSKQSDSTRPFARLVSIGFIEGK